MLSGTLAAFRAWVEADPALAHAAADQVGATKHTRLWHPTLLKSYLLGVQIVTLSCYNAVLHLS